MNETMNRTNTATRVLGDLYFITSTVVDWIDIFTRPKYKHIIVESLNYCRQHRALDIYAWVLMTNHLHMIVGRSDGADISEVIRDFKKFTSKNILTELNNDIQESRRRWMLNLFHAKGNDDKKIKNYKFWQTGFHPEPIYSYDFYKQKLDYIHQNPVRQELVQRPEEYLYSSALDYSGQKGLLDVIVVR